MQTLQNEIFYRYHSTLRGLGVSDGVMSHNLEWVRYFLDYGAKYGDDAPCARLIDGSLEKIASKGQSGGANRRVGRLR